MCSSEALTASTSCVTITTLSFQNFSTPKTETVPTKSHVRSARPPSPGTATHSLSVPRTSLLKRCD